MHASLGVPVWALIAEEMVVIICGCIYLGSTAAFNALINTAVILQIISFAIPCALLLLRGRSERFLAKGRWFCIPGWLGWVCNGIVVVYAVIEVVFFDLPTSIPTTGSSMSELSLDLLLGILLMRHRLYLRCSGHYGCVQRDQLACVCSQAL